MKTSVQINSKIKSFNKTLSIPGDKSISIRLILLASQANGKTKISNLLESEDVMSTIRSMRGLGIKIAKRNRVYEINGAGLNGYNYKKNLVINAGNSGTFARLFCGAVVKSDKVIRIIGDRSLSKRDFSRIIKPLKLFGVSFKSNSNHLPIKIIGTNYLRPIYYEEKKGSAQVKSSIMIASLNSPGETVIKSIPSRDHTELMFKHCLNIPINIKKNKKFDIIKIKGQHNYKGFNYIVPGDISSASFFIVLTILSKNSKLLIHNVNINKSRSGIIEILKKMNANILIKNKRKYNGETIGSIFIKSTQNLKSINCPKSINTKAIDEFLIIFLVCAKAKGNSVFKGLAELRNKESDRLKIASRFLKMIGIKVEEKLDSLKIYGNPNLNLNKKYVVKNYLKDHRVFMMSCIAALVFGGDFKILDKSSINTSFPGFLKILKKLGASIK